MYLYYYGIQIQYTIGVQFSRFNNEQGTADLWTNWRLCASDINDVVNVIG